MKSVGPWSQRYGFGSRRARAFAWKIDFSSPPSYGNTPGRKKTWPPGETGHPPVGSFGTRLACSPGNACLYRSTSTRIGQASQRAVLAVCCASRQDLQWLTKTIGFTCHLKHDDSRRPVMPTADMVG
jgi:hypothetical protein